ncbi:UvrD-helicase domain-containing protein [Litchfieldia salsa]|uniref:DNA 3'-5' helicase n=1 Tax=Litchfieldia salsa TaxID=930152 RepID=A0A1H0T849_9BACI|nr:UvrD-helicase domain-containing protein [Litchfieldia salsa]SDP50202.1 ATP-dependent helicase/nuclease subunit A [Litchfieldia salsa]
MTKRVVDQEARDKIKHCLNQNFLVEAGAGSGKTSSLVDRMVNLIYTGTCQIEEIVAITFTRKAADELKTRFQNELEKTWKSEKNFEVKERLEFAIQNMEQCFLGTVHSFCARLLRERPVEAKLDISFKELEEEDDRLIAIEAWHRYLATLQTLDVKRLHTLRELGIDDHILLDRFQMLKSYPDVEWAKTYTSKPELTDTYQAFINLLKEANRCIPEEIENGPDNLQKCIREAIRMDRLLQLNDPLRISVFELFDKKSAYNITQKKWTTKEDSKDYQARIQDFFEGRILPLLMNWRQFCHPIIIEFSQGALGVYEGIKQQRSLLNFQDLLINTTHLLRFNPEVRSYFQEKYRFLLVDEYQDTDPIQAEMMFYLTSDDVSEEDWSKCKPRPGSLFVVGDPKQAIYRFRRADIDIYNKVKELIKNYGGDVLQLTMNFRTVDTITTQLNDVFRFQLPEVETRYQAAYRPLNSYHEEQEEGVSGIKVLMVQAEFTKNQKMILEKDAENITLYLKKLLHTGYEPKEFMILTRYNDGIDVYARTLEAAGIPVSVSGEMHIGATQPFNELLLLLKTFLDSTDSLATVATLRSVWFGINDEELFQWKRGGGTFSIYGAKIKEVDEPVTNPVQNALSKLRMYSKWVGTYSPVVAIVKITEDIGFYPLLLTLGYGKREYTQFLQLIEASRRKENEGTTLYHEIVTFLSKIIKEKTKVLNLDEDANSVQILNVHKAKGLEAPIVFLAHPGKKTDISERILTHIRREDKTSQGYFKFVKKNGFSSKTIAEPIEWELYKDEEEAYLLQEELRILYVAATRAEKAMIISSCQKKNTNNPWSILIDGLKYIEEIVLEEIELVEKPQIIDTITHEEYQNETGKLTDWIEISSLPSFEKMTPTDDKEEIYTLEIEREKGGGKDWGLVIHEVFEKFIRTPLSGHDIMYILQKHGLSIDRENEVKSLIQQLQQTEIWKEIQEAENVLTEVPFSIPIKKGEELYTQLEPRTIANTIFLSGIIDLVYKVNGKWKIVDYKTDRPKDIEDIPELTNYYRKQIGLYKNVWKKITGEEVEEAKLYFVTPDIIRSC